MLTVSKMEKGTCRTYKHHKSHAIWTGRKRKTEHLAIKRMELEEKCKRIEQTAIEADAVIYPWILEGVTTDYATYRYLRDSKKIPCGKKMYYERRRKFYYLMSKKI